MAPANTGRESNKRKAVTKTDHTNNLNRSHVISGDRMLKIVVIKLIAPSKEDIPAKCREKIAKSTEQPPCPIGPDRGGYTVHPVPAPPSISVLEINNKKEGGNNQNLILFIRGNLISGAPINKGTIQFPNPPIITGITIKKIITKACAVTVTLYRWSSPSKAPAVPNSNRISNLSPVPTKPHQIPNNK